MTPASASGSSPRSARFLVNVSWNVAAFLLNLAGGILLSPYIIRKLGVEGYGVWALVFATIDYFWLTDLGFRSATLKYAAHYMALNQSGKVNSVISTAVSYFTAVAGCLSAVVLLLGGSFPRWFNVSPAYHDAAAFLFRAAGTCIAAGLVVNVFKATLEGLQQYPALNRIAILVTAIRVLGCFGVLALGGGLAQLGLVIVLGQSSGYVLIFRALRKALPQFELSWRLVNRGTLKEMISYGIHTMTATIGSQALAQGPVLLVGWLGSARLAGYFSLPVRLLASAVDVVSQVGMVTGASSADLWARGDTGGIGRMGAAVNRYCLMLFLAPAIVLSVYGSQLLHLWVGADVASRSGPLLPALTLGFTLAIAAQQNSSAILFGLGRHKWLARGLLVEAVLLVAGVVYLLPRHGLLAVASLVAALMLLNRGMLVPWLLCRNLAIPYRDYLCTIYVKPLLVALPVALLAWLARISFLPAANWFQLGAAAALIGLAYYIPAFFFVVEHPHRRLLFKRLGGVLPWPYLNGTER